MEILELENMKAVGDAMVGAIGSSRYPFTVDTPRNHDFVKRFHELHGVYPDMFDGETYEGLEWLAQVIQKAGTDDVEKVIDAWEDSSYEGLEGPFFMRKCDHQAVAARLHGGGGEGSQVPAPHPQDPRDVPRREGDAEVPDGGLLVAGRPGRPAWRTW